MDPDAMERLAPTVKKMRRTLGATKVLLFGSRSRGDYRADSDYDLLVVSEAFEGMRLLERLRTAGRLTDWRMSIDTICVTPRELEERRDEISVVGIAAREGVEIAT